MTRATRALFAVALLGCAGPTFIVQQYAGPARPPATIATLRVNGSEAVRLMTLDDEDVAAPVASDARLHVELLPGRHALTVRNANTPNEPPDALVFEAEAGRVYRVVFLAGSAADRVAPGPRIYEVDRGTDTLGVVVR